MTRTRPLVTVGIPTYNRPQALAGVIRAMLDQSYPHIEIIVTDDGESERTREALGELLPRIRYVANPQRLGLYQNWNRTIELASGELMAIYHDHDLYDRTLVERCVQIFERHPNVGIVHPAVRTEAADGTRREYLQPFGEVTPGREFARKQVQTWHSFVAHGAMMVRKGLYDRLGAFRPEIGFAADMDMLVRFALESDVGYVREILYQHHLRRPGDALFDFKWAHIEETIEVRALNVRRAYEDAPAQLALSLAKLKLDIDTHLLRHLLWAKVRERDELVAEGLDVLRRRGSAAAKALGVRAVSGSAPLSLARDLALQVRGYLKSGANHVRS